ncbi:ribosomal RNA-processing protein 17 [Carex littledalei]|uniref:Ribosomal RNA-processing protein 17 n=1 Tax=Carex littledalei TaxID=544730 RepID=A0A833QNA1_9POAL|nr:ribosomal RNA-processing protein 17 [Carex littledalei]
MEDYSDEEAVVVGQMTTVMVPRHIKKRSLKDKALSVSFDEKTLRDYVTGFHKRKKKRRKEANKQIEEKARLKRIAARKKRKAEKEMALYGKILSDDAGNNEQGEKEEEEPDLPTIMPETRTYEDSSTKVIVTTCEISQVDADIGPKHGNANPVYSVEKNPSLAVKKKPLKSLPKKKAHKKGKRTSFRKKDKRVKRARNDKGRNK